MLGNRKGILKPAPIIFSGFLSELMGDKNQDGSSSAKFNLEMIVKSCVFSMCQDI